MDEQGIPLFDELWDYRNPEETAKRFRPLLAQAESAEELSYLIQLLTQLARTQSLQRKFDEAHELLDRAEGLLEADLIIPRIRYLLERGRTFNSSSQAERARPLFLEAWQLAQDADAEFYAIDAAHMMGIAEESPDDQLQWNLRALHEAERAHSPRARQWLGALYNNIGWTYHDMGQYERALALFQSALRWREEEAEKKEPVAIRIARWCIARTLRSLERWEEALAMQTALLAEWEAEGGTQDGFVHEEMAECLLVLEGEARARPHFARAYELLSEDAWLAANEPDRLARLRDLSHGA